MWVLAQSGLGSAVLTAAASILAAIVGALIGSYATYRAQKRREKQKEVEEIRNLRIGLLTELVALLRYIKLVDNISDGSGIEFELHRAGSISAPVYNSNIDRITDLSNGEAAALIHLHGEIESVNRTFRAVAEASLWRNENNIQGLEGYAQDLSERLHRAIREVTDELDEDDIPSFITLPEHSIEDE